MTAAETYARDVVDGRQVAGKFIHLAAQRFLKDLDRSDIVFDEVEANKIVLFAERYCNLWEDKWRGKPVKIEPWMAFFLQQVYGWQKEGLRRIRKVYVQVSKKNAKSTISGIVALYHLFADERIGTPKIFVGANNEDQAKICVNISGKIIEQSPYLSDLVHDKVVELFRYKENIVNIVHNERDGFIKALPKETAQATNASAGGKHGFNPSLGVIDEYAMADSDSLLNTLESAQAAREEPLIFVITTAGFKQNGPCYSQLRRSGIEILEGRADDDSYLPFIWEADEGDSIEDEATWVKTNPNLNVSVFPEFLRSRIKAAKNEGGSKMVDVMTLNFNTWCEAAEVWVPSEVWEKNTHGISLEELQGAPCYTGYDFAARVDICAIAVMFFEFTKKMFPDGVERFVHPCLWFYWMPETKVKNNRERKDYSEWVKAGFINLVPGDTIEWGYIIEKMREVLPQYDHIAGAYDPYLATNGAIAALTEDGLDLAPINQDFRTISEPTKEWEMLLTAGQIEHFGNPVTAWMNKNTTIIRDANRNIKTQKIDGEKGSLKIDGIQAAINALARAMQVKADGQEEFGIEYV